MAMRGCDGVCAGTAPTEVARTKAAHAALRPPRELLPFPQRTRSIIDRDAPRNAADRDGDDRLAALGLDDGDVVAEAVGHIELALVARQRDAPGALADQNVALNLAARH